jgi:hypothetical protein
MVPFFFEKQGRNRRIHAPAHGHQNTFMIHLQALPQVSHGLPQKWAIKPSILKDILASDTISLNR